MKLQFFLYFLHQCGPLIATTGVGVIAWAALRALRQTKGCSARQYARQRMLWSNWS